MRPLLTSALATAILLVVLPTIPRRAEAKTGVIRCQMSDGSSAYTNQACGTLGATSMPLSADVLSRIASEQEHESRRVSLQAGIDAESIPATIGEVTAGVPSRRPLARGCATTPEQLAMDFHGSVALGDVNRIAESFDWAGMGNQQAQRIMVRLEQIAHRPVRGTEYFDASIGAGMQFADAGDQPSRGEAGLLQVTFDAGNGNAIVEFDVRRDKGCYFLRY